MMREDRGQRSAFRAWGKEYPSLRAERSNPVAVRLRGRRLSCAADAAPLDRHGATRLAMTVGSGVV